jgi:hypothetical protein
MLLTGNEEKLTCRSIEKAVGKKKTQPHIYLVPNQCSSLMN